MGSECLTPTRSEKLVKASAAYQAVWENFTQDRICRLFMANVAVKLGLRAS